jgi:DNA-directed RNA polymerase specialized sigma24 family protein
LRAAGADLRDIGDLRAWLVTVAARRSYDILKGQVYSVDTVQITDDRARVMTP